MVPKPLMETLQNIAEEHPSTMLDMTLLNRPDMEITEFIEQLASKRTADLPEEYFLPKWVWWTDRGTLYISAVDLDNIVAGKVI